MSQQEIFALMAHAQDLQKLAETQLATVQRAVKHMEEKAADAITDAIRSDLERSLANTKTALQTATESLKTASQEAKSTSTYLGSTGILQGMFLLTAALVIAAASYFALRFIGGRELDELNRIKLRVGAERAALVELQSKTWGLELVSYDDGTRGIILPRGTKIESTGSVQDGRIGIFIKP